MQYDCGCPRLYFQVKPNPIYIYVAPVVLGGKQQEEKQSETLLKQSYLSKTVLDFIWILY